MIVCEEHFPPEFLSHNNRLIGSPVPLPAPDPVYFDPLYVQRLKVMYLKQKMVVEEVTRENDKLRRITGLGKGSDDSEKDKKKRKKKLTQVLLRSIVDNYEDITLHQLETIKSKFSNPNDKTMMIDYTVISSPSSCCSHPDEWIQKSRTWLSILWALQRILLCYCSSWSNNLCTPATRISIPFHGPSAKLGSRQGRIPKSHSPQHDGRALRRVRCASSGTLSIRRSWNQCGPWCPTQPIHGTDGHK